jgi:cytochrome P450
MYVLNHPADVKHVLVTNQDNYRKAPVPPVESRIFGQGVLHTEGEIHHRQRRVLLPFFHANHVTAYTNLITSQARDRVALWQDDTTIDIGQEMAHLTLSVIWRLLFGQDLRSEGETIREAIAVGQSLIKLQYDSLLASVTPLWVPIPRHRRFTRGFRMIEERLFQFIHERRMAAEAHDDVLSLLLSATDTEGRPLSDEEIRDELMTFLLAGHETTANALTWTWFLLSQDGSVRERLTQELNEVLGDRLPNAADLPRLRYMKMIWDESLRLYPPAWTLHTRLAHAQDRLPSGAALPPGAWVFISPWSLHHNPRWFADPNRFDPERFSDEAQRTRPAFTYIPFGAGGRRCLGESFAEMEGLLILATIAATVRLHLVNGQTIRPEPVMTLRPNVPVQLIVQRVGISAPHPAVA